MSPTVYPKLPRPTRLLLVRVAELGQPRDGFTEGDVRLLQIVLTFQALDIDLEVQLAHS